MPSHRPPQTAETASRIWQERTDLVKQELAAASAAADAKTARLKALRLAKEAEVAQQTPETAPPVRKKTRKKNA